MYTGCNIECLLVYNACTKELSYGKVCGAMYHTIHLYTLTPIINNAFT